MSMIPGGKTGSVAALTATLATAVTLRGGVNRGPTSGSWLSGFACWRTCRGLRLMLANNQGIHPSHGISLEKNKKKKRKKH